eukprot:456398_1
MHPVGTESGQYETTYELKEEGRSKTTTILAILLAVTCVALIAVSIVAGIYGVKASTDTTDGEESKTESSNSPTASPTTSTTLEPTIAYCTTRECLQAASDIASSLNESVDPCHDFYHYVCDGWRDEQSWRHLDLDSDESVSPMGNSIPEHNRNVFLDALFYNTNDDLIQYESVQKAIQYFTTCHEAELSQQELEQSSIETFISSVIDATTFVDNSANINDPDSVTWDTQTLTAFHDTIQTLNRLDTNPLFQLEAESTKSVGYMQMSDLWLILFDPETLGLYIDVLFIPRYTAVYGVADTTLVRGLVYDFARQLMNITKGKMTDVDISDVVLIKEYPFRDLSTLFGSNSVMNYTKFVYDLFDVPPGVPVESFLFFQPHQSFFQSLSALVESESPLAVQFYVQFAVLWYYRTYMEANTQERDVHRTEFCYERTIEKFPYVYGYILFHEAYDTETYDLATKVAQSVKNKGVRVMLENADWLDDASRVSALKKINNMAVYIGSPPPLMDGNEIDQFYAKLPDLSADWMTNVQLMDEQTFVIANDTFWGKSHDLTGSWPTAFSKPADFGGWLIGVNAFYSPMASFTGDENGNWFTIPITISQSPFLVSADQYPSALTYGGMGYVTGHEMMHGFDPSGSSFNYNGTYVGTIYSNETAKKYDAQIQCFIDQYDGIPVDKLEDGTTVYVDGNNTIGENVADNAGLSASWIAWRDYILENGDDRLLHGVEMTQEQLFFVGAGRVWCETHKAGAYEDHDDVHAPNYARIIGTLQNMPEFADAFGCEPGSRMNPMDKCSIR